MNVVARMLTQEQDGIPGYMAHPDAPGQRPGVLMVHHAHGVTADYKIDAYRLACLGFNVLAPDLFNMFGIAGTTHTVGADLQAKHGDEEFLGRWTGLALPDRPQCAPIPRAPAASGHCWRAAADPFAADHPSVKAIVPTPLGPRRARDLAPAPARLPPGRTPVRLAGLRGGHRTHRHAGHPGTALAESSCQCKLVEWHFFSDANHGFRHPTTRAPALLRGSQRPLTTSFLQRTV